MGNASLIPYRAAEQKDSRDTQPGQEPRAGEQKRRVPVLTVESVIAPNPAVKPYAALAGYLGTGRSPSDAT